MNLDIFWNNDEGAEIACTRNVPQEAVAEMVRIMLIGDPGIVETGDTISFKVAVTPEEYERVILADRQKASWLDTVEEVADWLSPALRDVRYSQAVAMAIAKMVAMEEANKKLQKENARLKEELLPYRRAPEVDGYEGEVR